MSVGQALPSSATPEHKEMALQGPLGPSVGYYKSVRSSWSCRRKVSAEGVKMR